MYHPLKIKTFNKCLNEYPHYQDRINKAIDKICVDPYYRSHLLKQKESDLRGKRAYHVGDGKNFLIIFIICEECIEKGFKNKYNSCSFCDEITDIKTIIFLLFGPHEKSYKWESNLNAHLHNLL